MIILQSSFGPITNKPRVSNSKQERRNIDDKGVCVIFLAATEQNSDLNLVESGASDDFKVRILGFSSWYHYRIQNYWHFMRKIDSVCNTLQSWSEAKTTFLKNSRDATKQAIHYNIVTEDL